MKYIDKKLGQHIDITNKNAIVQPQNKKIVLLSINPFRADVFFDTEKQQFRIIGVKYAAFNFGKDGTYEINQVEYNKVLETEQINVHTHKFMYSFYRGDIIAFGNEDAGIDMYRFWSKAENGKNKVQVKPIDAPNFSDIQVILTVKQNTTILQKYTTDILGNQFLAPLEKDPREKNNKLSLTDVTTVDIMGDKQGRLLQ